MHLYPISITIHPIKPCTRAVERQTILVSSQRHRKVPQARCDTIHDPRDISSNRPAAANSRIDMPFVHFVLWWLLEVYSPRTIQKFVKLLAPYWPHSLVYPTTTTIQSRRLSFQAPTIAQSIFQSLVSLRSLSHSYNTSQVYQTHAIKHPLHKPQMLRRKPTQISLTTEDIAAYEDARAKEAAHEAQLREQAAQEQYQQNGTMQNKDPNASVGRTRGPLEQKTRTERLGLGMGNGGGSRN